MAKAIATFTISDLNDGAPGAQGAPGQDALVAVLTNETHTLTADKDGNISSYAGATTQIKVYEGTSDVTSQYTITKAESGVSGNLSGSTYSVTSVTNGIGGIVTLTATKGTKTIQKVFTVSVSKAGADGTAKIAKIISSSTTFLNDGRDISPDNITLTPNLENVTYSKWQHSLDGGITWIDTTSAVATITAAGVLTLNAESTIFNVIKYPVFKLVTSDPNIYDQQTINMLIDRGEFDTSDFVTHEDISSNTSKVYTEQPTPPYKVGDVWIVQEGPDKGKLKTCVIDRQDGVYTESDWITPLTAYTTVQTFEDITGESIDEWDKGKKSITKRVNEANGEIESIETQIAKLSVRSSDIEMSFSKTGTSNFLGNSSGQYGTRYWNTEGGNANTSFSTVTSADAGDVRKQIVAGYAFKVSVYNWSGLSSYKIKSEKFIPPAGNEFSVSLKIKNEMKYSKVKIEVQGYATNNGKEIKLDGNIGEFDAYYEDGNDFVLHRKLGLSKRGTYTTVVFGEPVVSEYDVEKIECILTISLTDTIKMSSLPEYNERENDGAYKYMGKLVSVNNGSTYSYCNSLMTGIGITESDTVPSVIHDNEVWKCSKTVFDDNGKTQYLKEVYYNDIHGNIEAISDNYEIAQLDSSKENDPYKKQLPTEFESAASISTPNTGIIYIADIMFNGGYKIQTWTPRQDEVLYGSRIKFSSAGIEIQSEAGFKRILNEQTDVAYKIDSNGNIIGIIWKLSTDGMFVKNIYCYGTISMGKVTDELNTDTFKNVMEMKRSDSDDGIDEYIYS